MPILIEDMQAELQPERGEQTEAAAAEIAAPTPALLATITEQLRREQRVRDERRQRWQAD